MRRVRTRGVRRNMSWLVLGARIMKLSGLHPSIQKVASGATRRGMKWYAYRMIEEDKYRNRKPAGQFLWIPKANLIGHVSIAEPGSGGFLGYDKPTYHSVSWDRPHPLARNIKEVWDVHQWGTYRKGKIRRHGGGKDDVSNAPEFAHWLEAREVAEREGRTITPYRQWQEEMSEPFHSTWLRTWKTSKGRPARNPRITIQFYRDRKGVIRAWGTGMQSRLPDRHVLLVDYKHGGIFDTWKSGGGRNFELVKHL